MQKSQRNVKSFGEIVGIQVFNHMANFKLFKLDTCN